MYVRRDDEGNITAAYTVPQKNPAVEPISPDDPELLAFLDPPSAPVADQVKESLAGNAALAALVRKLAKDAGVTEQEMIDGIAAEAKVQVMEV